MTWPRPTTTRWSAVSCSSLIRWLDTSTARPWAASDRRNPRIHTMPSGSMPLNGSSIISTGGSPSSAAAMPSRCRMPRENPPALRRIAGLQPGLLDHLVDPLGVQALGVGQPQQVVAGAAARLQRGGVQQRPDMAQRVPQARVRLAADQRGALVGGVQAEDHPHGGGFPGAVRADEAGHLARGDGERHPVQGQHRPEPLAQAADFDGCFHACQLGNGGGPGRHAGEPSSPPSQEGRRYPRPG